MLGYHTLIQQQRDGWSSMGSSNTATFNRLSIWNDHELGFCSYSFPPSDSPILMVTLCLTFLSLMPMLAALLLSLSFDSQFRRFRPVSRACLISPWRLISCCSPQIVFYPSLIGTLRTVRGVKPPSSIG